MVNGIITPDYQVKYYREGFYKVIRFNTPRLPRMPGERKGDPSADKLDQALSRAKSMIQQIAICNDWDYFFTCTIDKQNFDRYDLDVFRVKFPQWIRDYNKKYVLSIKYLIVPEQHKDGAFHIHGFLSGLPERFLCKFVPGLHKRELVDGGYLNWPHCSKKFGYCSLAPVRDIVKAGFYCSKYITKSLVRDFVGYGSHLYYCSLKLRRAVPLGYLYGRTLSLDQYLNHHSEYCSTGYADESVWDYLWHCYDPDEFWFLDDDGVADQSAAPAEIVTNVEYEQLRLFLSNGGMV